MSRRVNTRESAEMQLVLREMLVVRFFETAPLGALEAILKVVQRKVKERQKQGRLPKAKP